jgi:adenine-specific DNA-methyltransferase
MTPDESCIVYTPSELANALVSAILPKSLSPYQRWLEPCVGKGALLAALMKQGIASQQITGIDLARTSEPADSLARVHRGLDFLGWSKRTMLRFDRVVANPPYLAIRELRGELLENALTTTVPIDGTFVPHRANCWYAFLCASIALLRPGGSLAFVLPAAWEYADYATPMRLGIASLFHSVTAYRSIHPLFSGVQEGAVILVARGYGESESRPMLRAVYERTKFMFRAVGAGVTRKATSAVSSAAFLDRGAKPLFEIATIRIGAVTGDGSYFLLNESRREELGLPMEAMVPILSRASHLEAAEVTRADWKRLRDSGERIWLFRPPESLRSHPAVRKYLRLPREDGGCDRNALQIRRRKNEWYRVRLPRRPDGFVSGMGRFGPWVALCRDSGLTATNTLYALRFRDRLSIQEMSAWSLMLLCEQTQQQMESVLRQYPDGLVKVEPGDFARLRLPVPRRVLGALGSYRDAVGYLVAGDKSKAIAIANRYL